MGAKLEFIFDEITKQIKIDDSTDAWNIFKGYFIGDQAYKEVVGEVEKAKAKASEKVDKMVELDEGDRS